MKDCHNIFHSLVSFFKNEIVFLVSFCLALISAFLVPPDKNYFSYIDWNTIFLLFSLMAIVSGLGELGVYKKMGEILTSHVKSTRSLALVLVFLCFFMSMFLTNDVALLTFVPFAISVLISSSASPWTLVWTLVLQTLAANLGSMLTPLGNPQNLFLYEKMNLEVMDFMKIIFPYSLASFILLLVCLLFIPNEKILHSEREKKLKICSSSSNRLQKIRFALYIFLFILSLVFVSLHLKKYILACLTFFVILVFDIKNLKKIDWMLLLTFIAFFIFTGNISRIESINNFLSESLLGREFLFSILSSQVISNVPATLLLFPFSKDYSSLLLGVNLGGLGTIVASLASLISFKFYSRESLIPLPDGRKKMSSLQYLGVFTIANLIFLFILVMLSLLFKGPVS